MFRPFCYLSLVLASLAFQGCVMLPSSLFGGGRGEVSPEVVEKANHFWTADQILLIPLTGTVDTGSAGDRKGLLTKSGPGMLVELKDRLKVAEEDERIKAVVLRIDSPGGSVTSADLIYHELIQFKEKKKVPVIALMTDMAASGGLYIAMAADEVYALPTTVTGSIGVIMLLPGLKGLSDKVGFEMRVVESGKHKDIGSPWRNLTDEDRKIFQGLIDKYYQFFLQIIMKGRQGKGLTMDELKQVADGRILDAESAQKAHLIDGIKYPQDVLERAKAAAGIKDAKVITYEYPFTYRGNIYARGDGAQPQAGGSGQGGGDINVLKLDMGGMESAAQGPRFMYLCLP